MVAMGYTERIHEARPKLSKSFKRLADYILDSYIQAALMTASELAQEVNVDAATVVRFAQALDYSGFPELQDEIKDRVLADLHLEPGAEAAAESAAGILDRSFQSFTQSLERTRKLLDSPAAEELAGHLQQARTLIAVTERSHEGVLRYFLNQVGELGIAHQFQALEAGQLAKALAAADEQDFLLVLDMSGRARLFGAAIDQAKKLGISTGAIVGGASYASARKAQSILEVRAAEEGESDFLLLAAVLESLLKLLRAQLAQKYSDYEARHKTALRALAPKA